MLKLNVQTNNAAVNPPPTSTTVLQQFLANVQASLGGISPQSILTSFSSLNSIQDIQQHLNSRAAALDDVVEALNALPTPFARDFPHLHVATSVASLCHPLLLQTFTPIATTADGNCMYHALSTIVCGSKRLSMLFRLLAAYAVVKHRGVMMNALPDAFPQKSCDQHSRKCNTLIASALRIGSWGSDFHLFTVLHFLYKLLWGHVP